MRVFVLDVYFEFLFDKKEIVKNKCISVKVLGIYLNKVVVVGMGILVCFVFGMLLFVF